MSDFMEIDPGGSSEFRKDLQSQWIKRSPKTSDIVSVKRDYLLHQGIKYLFKIGKIDADWPETTQYSIERNGERVFFVDGFSVSVVKFAMNYIIATTYQGAPTITLASSAFSETTDGSESKRVGRLDLIIGPMWAGKSTELLRRVRRHAVANERCLIVKPSKDTRFNATKITHDGDGMEDKVEVMFCDRLGSLPMDKIFRYDVIAIDEGQFFDDLCATVCTIVDEFKRNVIVAGLDGTFKKKPFPNMMELIPLAESVTKLTAVCMECHREAIYSYRTAASTDVELVGGKESYKAVCRACYRELDKKK